MGGCLPGSVPRPSPFRGPHASYRRAVTGHKGQQLRAPRLQGDLPLAQSTRQATVARMETKPDHTALGRWGVKALETQEEKQPSYIEGTKMHRKCRRQGQADTRLRTQVTKSIGGKSTHLHG